MTALETEANAGTKLPIWQTVKAGYRDTFGNFGAFLRAACIPFVLTLGLALALPEDGGPAASILGAVLATVFAVLFELTWYRFLLLGPGTGSPLLPRFDRTLWVFFGYTLLLMLPIAPAEGLFLLLGSREETGPAALYVIAGVLYLLGVYLSLRIGFSRLWIAVGATGRFGDSWRRTRKNGLRLLLAVGLLSLPLFVVVAAAGTLIVVFSPETAAQIEESGKFEGWPRWADIVITQAGLFFFYGISCGALVRAFCVLTGWVSNREELLERFE